MRFNECVSDIIEREYIGYHRIRISTAYLTSLTTSEMDQRYLSCFILSSDAEEVTLVLVDAVVGRLAFARRGGGAGVMSWWTLSVGRNVKLVVHRKKKYPSDTLWE